MSNAIATQLISKIYFEFCLRNYCPLLCRLQRYIHLNKSATNKCTSSVKSHTFTEYSFKISKPLFHYKVFNFPFMYISTSELNGIGPWTVIWISDTSTGIFCSIMIQNEEISDKRYIHGSIYWKYFINWDELKYIHEARVI